MSLFETSETPGGPYWPSEISADLAALGAFKKKVGIVRLWPDQAAAEHESIERFRAAFSLLGVDLIEVDRLGTILNGPRRKITQDDVDFVVSLHYETPKAYDCFSWGALWNPVDFYVEWGLTPYLDNQLSHDGYFVCGSTVVDRLMRTELGDAYADTPFVSVNHTLSGPVFPVRGREDRRIAYCGINWERLSKAKGRFDGLLTRLDAAGVLDIFGPEEVRGVRVWEGFKGYKYSVPFDGQTLIRELSNSGAVLALSSEAHIRSGIMSNRLFEGAAAGALVFADQNPFVERFFKNEVVEVPMTPQGEPDAGFIISTLEHFNRHPDQALEKARSLQAKFTEFYSLHKQLLNAYAGYAAWREEQARKTALNLESPARLDCVVLHLDGKTPLPIELLQALVSQQGVQVRVSLVVARAANGDAPAFEFLPEGDIRIVPVRAAIGAGANSVGYAVAEVLADLEGDYVSVFLGHEVVFKGYAAQLTGALKQGDAAAARGGVLIRHYDPATREFDHAEFVDYARPKGKHSTPSMTLANFVFRRSALTKHSGAFQLMGWSGMVNYLHGEFMSDEAIVDMPLLTADLKRYERMQYLKRQPYEASKAIAVLDRYSIPNVRALREAAPAGMPVTPASVAALPEHDRREIIISLLKALPLPPWLIKGCGKIIRLAMGIRKRKA